MEETTQQNQPQIPATGASQAVTKKIIYPNLVIKNNEHPNKLLAFPFFGIIIKFILLIPVFLYLFLLAICMLFYWIVLPFVILFTGRYWNAAYKFVTALMRYNAKISYYMYGLTDKYPGFNTSEDGLFEFTMDMPSKPSRLLAFPLLGFLIRLVLLIPYTIYMNVLQNGASVAMFCSWFAVLIKGKYPESLYEFNRDSVRVSLSSTAYIMYMSDTYPSFSISMSHKKTKIILIVLGALLTLANSAPDSSSNRNGNDMKSEYSIPSSNSSF